MNSNKTQCILFATPNFNKRTETFQIIIDDTVKHMEDKVKNLGVIFDSHLSFEQHIESLCSQLNLTTSYLNKMKKTLEQMSRILITNGLIFSHLNYCCSIWVNAVENCSMKCKNVSMASNGKYLKRDHITPLLRDLKWINFISILRLNEASVMLKKIIMLQQIQMLKILTMTSKARYHRE